MLATESTIATDNTKNRSMFKPKFWRSNKTSPLEATGGNVIKEDEKPPVLDSVSRTPTLLKMPTMKLPSPSMPTAFKKSDTSMVLKETGKNEVYELSTINDSGVYLAPALLQANGKHDHWLCVDEDAFRFSLPSQECLTTGLGRPHSFYTPSSIIVSS